MAKFDETQLTKKMVARLLIATLCVVSTQVAIWYVNYSTGLMAAQAATVDVTALPRQIGEWSGTPDEFDERLFAKTGASSMVNYSCRNGLGRQASVHLASFSLSDIALPHTPPDCYSRSGWNIVRNEWQTDSHDRRYRFMLVERNGLQVAVVYWYQLGPNVVGDQDDLRRLLLKLRIQGKAWPPLVKVLIVVPVETSQDDAREQCDDLGAPIYDWILANS